MMTLLSATSVPVSTAVSSSSSEVAFVHDTTAISDSAIAQGPRRRDVLMSSVLWEVGRQLARRSTRDRRTLEIVPAHNAFSIARVLTIAVCLHLGVQRRNAAVN